MKYIPNMMNLQDSNKQSLISQEQQQRSLTQIDTTEWLNTNYPLLSNRKEPVSSLAVAVKDKTSLVLLDKRLGEGVALNWVKAQLLDTYRILGASQVVNSLQIVFMARRIRSIYYYLSPSELTYFFESVIGGMYGDIYVGKSINPQNLMNALICFDKQRANTISELEYSSHEQFKKEESKPANIKLVNEICKRLNKEYVKNHIGSKASKPYEPYKKKE